MRCAVRLTYVDNQPARFYNMGELDTILDNDINHPVDTCKVFTDAQGYYFAQINSAQELDGDLFFYYSGLHDNYGYYHFTRLHLMTVPLTNKPKTKLKDMIV